MCLRSHQNQGLVLLIAAATRCLGVLTRLDHEFLFMNLCPVLLENRSLTH